MKHASMVVTVMGLVAIAGTLRGEGLAAKYPADRGIAKDPAVLFSEDFEREDFKRWDEKKGPVALETVGAHHGEKCVAMPMHRGRDHGGHLIKWFMPGADKAHARFYVKFSGDY